MQPFGVDDTTDTEVWSVSRTGTVHQSGGLQLLGQASPPTTTRRGYLQLFSPDGSVLKTITSSGTVSTIPVADASGNVTITGLLTVSPGGTIALGGGVNIYANVGNLQTDNYFVMPNGQSTGSFSVFGNTATSFSLGTVGGGIAVKEGSNARMGTLTLTGATPVVVANTSVTAADRIFLTTNTPGGTPGFCWVSARSAGVSFSVTGTAGDTSTVAYQIVRPA